MHSEVQLDAVPPQDLGESLAELLRLAGQHPISALDQHDLATQPADSLGHFDADRAAAQI